MIIIPVKSSKSFINFLFLCCQVIQENNVQKIEEINGKDKRLGIGEPVVPPSQKDQTELKLRSNNRFSK